MQDYTEDFLNSVRIYRFLRAEHNRTYESLFVGTDFKKEINRNFVKNIIDMMRREKGLRL